MAEHLELTCDQCGHEDEAPVVGWVSIKPAKKSQVVAIPPAKGDFCGIECLQKYIGRMVVQKELRATVVNASFDLDTPLACPKCGTVIEEVYREAFLGTAEEPDDRRCFECVGAAPEGDDGGGEQ